MIKSIYRNLSQAIKLEKTFNRSYDVRYYPVSWGGIANGVALATVAFDEEIQIYPDNIKLVPAREVDLCRIIAKHINQACKELNIKTHLITIGYYHLGHKRGGGSYKLCYYSKLYKDWVIGDCYCFDEAKNYDYLLSIRVELNPYHRLEEATKSFSGLYWSDPFYSLTGVVYLPIRYITPEVAKDIILYQIENGIEPSRYLQSQLDEEGREILDTANNLLALKEVS